MEINGILPQRHSDKNLPQGLPQELLQFIGKYGLNSERW